MLSSCNLGTTLGGKPKIGAKLLCCILLSFILGYQSLLGTKPCSALDFGELWRGCFLEQNQVSLWTLESFGGVASRNKIVFCSGLCWALERSLLSRSALDFVEESFCRKFTITNSLRYHSNPWVESKTLSYMMVRDCFLTRFKVVPLWFWTDGQARRGDHNPGMVIFGPIRAC